MIDRDEVANLRLQLRRAKEKQAEMFDRGFVAATRMVEAGATPERLRDAAGIPTRADTEPFVAFDPEDTLVDAQIPEGL